MMTAVIALLADSFEIVQDSIKASNYISSKDIREDRAIFYIDLTPEYKNKISYRVKLLSSEEYTLPAVFAESMYRRNIYGSSSPAKFTVYAKH